MFTLETTQYSERSNSISESSGSRSGSRPAGSQLVRPKARLPMYMFSVARIWTTMRSPETRGSAVNTYPLEYSSSCRHPIVPDPFSEMFGPASTDKENIWFEHNEKVI